MIHLSLRFLGGFEAALNDQALAFATDKARAMLAYLAVESDHAHTRGSLAALLWPDYPEENARTTLRHVLHLLRQLLGDEASESPYLLVTRQTLQFNSAAPHTLDVAAFTSLLKQTKTHAHDKLELCEHCLAQLRQAVAFYRGDFLADLTVRDSTMFEEWRRLEQERLHLQAVNALIQLAVAYEANGDDEHVQRYAAQLIELEPYSDIAFCLLMRALTRLDERNGALAAYRKFSQVLREELNVEPQPTTTDLYEAIRVGRFPPSANPPVVPAAAPVQRPTIPASRPALLGRSAELAHIATLLSQADCRLVTLIGPPGVGKTSLSLEVAHQQREAFSAGVVVVELASISDPGLVLSTLARALAVPERSGQLVQETLIHYLRDKALLLVLDNFEHVLASAPLLSPILAQCPHVKVLATSRAALQLREERRYAIEPLHLPSLAERANLAQLQYADVVQLFQARARSAKPDFRVTQANVQNVAELCIRLDGLPLAIELAAARIRLMTLPTMLARLEKPLNLLRNGSQVYATRQQTLRNAIAWSYALLNEGEQRIFRSLAVFVDGFTVDAAENVCATLDEDLDVLDGIESLLDKSLLKPMNPTTPRTDAAAGENSVEQEPRFRMLESIRAFGLEELEANPTEAEAVRQRHVQFFLALAEQAEPLLHGVQQRIWLKRIQAEHNNFRAALDGLTRASQVNDPTSAEAAMRLVSALRYFWYAADYLTEGLQRSQRTLVHPLAVGRTAVRAKALNAAGYFHHVLGQPDAACPLLEEALAIGREVGDNAVIAYALQYIAVINPWRDWAQAQTYLEESVALFRTLSRPFNLATTLVRLGDVAQKQNAYDLAEASYEESVALLQQVNHRLALPFAMRHQAYLLIRRNELERASVLCAESFAINLEMNDLPGVAACLVACAVVAQKQNKLDRAIHLLAACDGVLEAQQTKLLPTDQQHAVATLKALELKPK